MDKHEGKVAVVTEGNSSFSLATERRATSNLAVETPLSQQRTEEVARAALFLVSDDSTVVASAGLFVGGGLAQILRQAPWQMGGDRNDLGWQFQVT